MATFHQIFFDPGHRRAGDAARAVVDAVGGQYLENDTDVGLHMVLDVGGTRASAVGPVWENAPIATVDPTDPCDREIVDDLPVLWSATITPREDEAWVRTAAFHLFRIIAGHRLGWPMVLTHNFGELVATYDAERGVRKFPPGTRSDGTDEVLWR